jgi:hypothetical protein
MIEAFDAGVLRFGSNDVKTLQRAKSPDVKGLIVVANNNGSTSSEQLAELSAVWAGRGSVGDCRAWATSAGQMQQLTGLDHARCC